VTLAQEYPIRLLCALLDFPRSSFYYHGHGADESELEKALLHLAPECSRLDRGYRRLTAQLRREGWEVNGKRVRRLMRCLGLQRPQAKRKRRTTDSDHTFPRYPNLVQDLLAPERGNRGSGLGSGHHLCAFASGGCLSGRLDGCLHAPHSWLAPGA